MATGTPRHTWTDNVTPITAAKLNELEQDTADALATANAVAGYTDEQVRDVVGATLVAGSNVTITPNDGADTITIAASGGGGSTAITPEQFGANGDDTTDDQTALAAAIVALSPGDTLFLAPGKTYRHSNVLDIFTDGVTITGGGTLRATNEQLSAVRLRGDNITVDGITLTCPVTTQRWDAFEHHKLLVRECSGATVRNVTVDGSAAAGILMWAATNYLIDTVTVRNTRADGIHSTAASSYGRILDPLVENSGDDCVAVVSYATGFDVGLCHHIKVAGARVRNSNARLFAVVGGEDIDYTDCQGEASNAAGIYVGAEEAFNTYGVARVLFENMVLREANTLGSVDHGAILIISELGGQAAIDVTIRNVTAIDTKPTATWQTALIVGNGGTASGVLLDRVVYQGVGPVSEWYTNAPATAYDRYSYTVERLPQAPAIREVVSGSFHSNVAGPISLTTSSDPSVQIRAGDTLLVVHGNDWSRADAGGGSIGLNAPGGTTLLWTNVANALGELNEAHLKVWRATADTDGPLTVTANQSEFGNDDYFAALYVIKGEVVVEDAATNRGTGTSQVAPSVISGGAYRLMLSAWQTPWVSGGGNATWTAVPAGMTQRSLNTEGGDEPGAGGLLTATQGIDDDGPTGTRTATYNHSRGYAAVSLLLAPPGAIPQLSSVPTLEELQDSRAVGAVAATATHLLATACLDQRIAALSLAATGAITASNTNYWSIALVRYRAGTATTIATRTTQITAPNGGITANTTWNFDLIAFGSSQYLQKDDVLALTFTTTGTPTALAGVTATWRYEPGVTA